MVWIIFLQIVVLPDPDPLWKVIDIKALKRKIYPETPTKIGQILSSNNSLGELVDPES